MLSANRTLPSDWIVRGGAVFLIMMGTGGSGALITFSRTTLYSAFGDAPLAWGLTPLEDQQLGGLLMWVSDGVIYLVVALAIFARLLQAAGRATAFPKASSTGNMGVQSEGLSQAWNRRGMK